MHTVLVAHSAIKHLYVQTLFPVFYSLGLFDYIIRLWKQHWSRFTWVRNLVGENFLPNIITVVILWGKKCCKIWMPPKLLTFNLKHWDSINKDTTEKHKQYLYLVPEQSIIKGSMLNSYKQFWQLLFLQWKTWSERFRIISQWRSENNVRFHQSTSEKFLQIILSQNSCLLFLNVT